MTPTPHDRPPTDDGQHGPGRRQPAGPGDTHPGRPSGPTGPGREGQRRPGATRQRTASRGSRRATRRALRRESPSTIAVLANAVDFAAMRRYESFPFADHARYLRQVEGLLRARAAHGGHTTVALFDPAAYRAFCAETDLDPDQPTSRARYAAASPATSPTLPYEGQSLGHLIAQLLDAEEHQATLTRAVRVLASMGECAECGEDVASAALTRAGQAVHALLRSAGPGRHHLVCSVPTHAGSLIAVLHVRAEASEPSGSSPHHLPDDDREAFRATLAVGLSGTRPGGVVLRTTGDDQRDTVRGWAIRDHWLSPLTEAQVFSAYCTDPDTGEPLSPESGVDYRAGFPLPRPDDNRRWPSDG
ncbi:hypothetical protein [Streptomyces buecherae]|uniref:hypothetical protein n=1 Tax=Streptomyces buecherae TaxID=2763006 RepID=UPI00365EEE24